MERDTVGERKIPNKHHPHLVPAQKVFVLLLLELVGRLGIEKYPPPSPDPVTLLFQRYTLGNSKDTSFVILSLLGFRMGCAI